MQFIKTKFAQPEPWFTNFKVNLYIFSNFGNPVLIHKASQNCRLIGCLSIQQLRSLGRLYSLEYDGRY